MSLYEYELCLVREVDRGDLLSSILKSNFMQTINEEEVSILGHIDGFVSESINQVVSSCPLQIVKLELDESQLESSLMSNGREFIHWLQTLVQEYDIAYAFISGGNSSDYYREAGITSEKVFKQVSDLVNAGTVEIVHPVMFFAERLGQGKICTIAREAPFTVREMPGTGCLLLLISGDIEENGIEILDPGVIYPKLRDYFQHN